ncbi:MAG: M48 family metalloprotease, partial [Planctomycetaceae bacterium]|nr:M48 family metalloprotease [Planctomycetaceae bacterium]
MTPAVAALNSWSDSWATLVVALVWQSTLLALVVAGVCWTLRRASPAIRYWLWQIVALKLLLIPLWTVTLPLPGFLALPPVEARATLQSAQTAEASPSPRTAPLAGSEVSRTAAIMAPDRPGSPRASETALPSRLAVEALRELTWRSWLLLAWMAIVLGQGVVVARQWNRLRKLLRGARPGGDELLGVVASCCARVRLHRVPRVVQVAAPCSPFVCGLLRPTVVLPETIESLVDRNQLAPVLTHEVAHLRRRDLLWNWIPQLARMLFFFHPVAPW